MDDVACLKIIDSDQGQAWNSHINVNGHNVLFKIITGIEVIVISDNITKSIGLHQIHCPTKTLHGPDNCPLQVIGEATVRLVYRGTECTQSIVMASNVKKTLLGFPAQVLSIPVTLPRLTSLTATG